MNIDWIGAEVKQLLHDARVKVRGRKIGCGAERTKA